MTQTMTLDDTKLREDRVRRKAKRAGYLIRKSRVRKINLDDMGGYRILILSSGGCVRGQRFDLDLDDVESFLEEESQ